jgi:hypothetical protein
MQEKIWNDAIRKVSETASMEEGTDHREKVVRFSGIRLNVCTVFGPGCKLPIVPEKPKRMISGYQQVPFEILMVRQEKIAMSRISLGFLCGLVFGSIDTALMIPLSFPDKRAAMLGAFIARFGLGFVICNVRLPLPGWVVGLLLGVLLSLPDAIITKAMVPILASGAVGGLIIGLIASRFGR